MKINKKIIIIAIVTIFIVTISLIYFRKTNDTKQEDPYEIKKVQNFNYQPQYYAKDFTSGFLLFLTEQGELYKCESDGEIKKIKNINLKVKKLYCFGEDEECYFIDSNGELYYTSLLDPISEPIKIEGISNVKSLSITEGYYGAVTESGDLYMWIKSKSKDWIPFKSLSSSVPELIPSILDVENVVCSFNYMALLTKSGEVYECGIKEVGEEKNVEPVFKKIKDLKKILQIAVLDNLDLIAISKHKIYRIGYPGIRGLRVERRIDYTIEQMSTGYLNIAYVTNRGDIYLLGESFWYHDPTFDLTIPKKLNGIENVDAIYGGGVVYVVKDNQVYIMKRVNQSSGIK